jgi:hypothetical protein
MDVGSTGDPALPSNLASLSPITINGDSGLSALDPYGTLTQNSDGSYTFDGDGNQVPSLTLNGVSDLTITDAVFGNTGSNGGVTINGDSNDDVVTDSTFSNVGYGVGVFQSGGVDPTNIGVINDSFSDINGPWPAASAVEFDGAGASATPAAANGENVVAYNTVNDASTNSALSGQDIMSFYNYGDGADNSNTLVYANSISGSYTPADGSHPPDTAINFELSNGGTIAGNYVTAQSNAGIANDGSTDTNFIGNLVTASTSDYQISAEGGVSPTGTWTYNAADNSPQVAITDSSSSRGWPVVYAPDGAPDDPGSTNSWDA